MIMEIVKKHADSLTVREYILLKFIVQSKVIYKSTLVKQTFFDLEAFDMLVLKKLVTFGVLEPLNIFPSPDADVIVDYAKNELNFTV